MRDGCAVEDQQSASASADIIPRIDFLTIVGLTLLCGPLFVMLHEIGGHAVACLTVGAHPTDIGAYYIDCDTNDWMSARIVAAAGVIADFIAAAIAFILFPKMRSDFGKFIMWMAFTMNAMTSAGYFLFSGVAGIGDLAPGADGGMGEMAHPWLWRSGLILIGFPLYWWVVTKAMAMMTHLLGGGEAANKVRRKTVLTIYFVNGLIGLLVGLFNPVGFVIVATSALASSFGGLAGFWSVAYAGPRTGEPRPFRIERNWLIIAVGVIMVGLFAAILGPTLHPYGVVAKP